MARLLITTRALLLVGLVVDAVGERAKLPRSGSRPSSRRK